MTDLLDTLYETFVYGKEKALAGAGVAFAVAFVAQHLGYHVSNGLQQTVTAFVIAGLTHLAVYSKANRA